jgi:hypothetical protein
MWRWKLVHYWIGSWNLNHHKTRSIKRGYIYFTFHHLLTRKEIGLGLVFYQGFLHQYIAILQAGKLGIGICDGKDFIRVPFTMINHNMRSFWNLKSSCCGCVHEMKFGKCSHFWYFFFREKYRSWKDISLLEMSSNQNRRMRCSPFTCGTTNQYWSNKSSKAPTHNKSKIYRKRIPFPVPRITQ